MFLLGSIVLCFPQTAVFQLVGQKLLLDEVAAHLDTRRRGELFDILCALPTQVWMTGTDTAAFLSLKNRGVFYDVEESVLTELLVA